MRGKANFASRLQCVLLLLMVARMAAAGGVIYVDADAAGANNGSNWENAYVFLQDALADANSVEKPVEIWVAQGIYKPDHGANQTLGDQDTTFQLINSVMLKGGYAGFDELDPNERNVDVYKTILSGDLNGDDVQVPDPYDLPEEPTRAENSCHVVTGSNTDETAVLYGFTIAGGSEGNVIGTTGDLWWCGYGGGLYNLKGSPTLIGCTFINNWASGLGGGMYNECGNPKLTNCIFTDNIAGLYGGGMANMSSNTILTDCTFSGNFSANNAGGIANIDSSSTLLNCTFSENSAFWNGGGMLNETYQETCILTLTDCTFSENTAMWAGGMSNHVISPELTNCNFSGNSASDVGGGMYNSASDPIMTNCTFNLNSAKWGGAFDNRYSSPTLTNCIISGNSATYGGGMDNLESNLTLTNCTFAQNSAQYGNTLSCDSSPRQGSFPSNFELNNCILWNGGNEIWNNDASTIDITYSDVQGGWPGENNIDVDPLFVNQGYWDPNGTVDDPNDDYWIDGDYHLKSQAGRWDPVNESWVVDDITSPCIDTGDPNSPVVFEPFTNGRRINMGAYGGTAKASKSPSGIHAKYGGGTGEPNDPYLIYTAEHLNTIGIDTNDCDKHFKLMADIDLDPNLPGHKVFDEAVIGYFKGVFDGNGHTISNFSYTSSGGLFVGLFRQISGQNAQIKDLGLIAPDINAGAGSHVGSLVGQVSSGTITNCYAEGGSVSGEDLVGGLVGLNHGDLNDCFSTCNVSGKDDVGGLVGLNSSATITNCSAGGEVFGRDRVGGLAGRSSGTIKNSSATGSVTGENRSIVTRENRSIGGLIGHNSGPLISCSAGGDVSGDTQVGGLVGKNSDSIINCYATGGVLGTEYVGGLVGFGSVSIINCYATGGVSGTTYVGGLVGYKGQATVLTSFWNIETSGQLISGGGTGKTTAQMQMARTFLNAGWDFVDETANGTEDIWRILEGQDYPRLWWEQTENLLLND